MISPRTYFARMNEGRSSWLTEAQLIKGCEEFFKANGYDQIEYDKMFSKGEKVFNSLLVASKGEETVATYFRPKLDRHDIVFFGHLESMLFDVLDNYDMSLMLVTDSLSYMPIIKTEELSVAVENLMDEGMFLLFLNSRSAYAFFDEFKKLSMPVPAPY